MAKATRFYREHIEFDIWIALDGSGGTIRTTRTEPDLSRNERAMFVTIKVPRSIFSLPLLKGEITVDDPGTGNLTAKVQHNANEALRQALGVDIDLKVHTLHEEESNESPHDRAEEG